MTQFVKLGFGSTMTAIDTIEHVRETGEGTHVVFKDGRERDYSYPKFEELYNMCLPVIPSLPGFTLLLFWENEAGGGDPFIERQPIIGWRVEEDNTAKPIIADELNRHDYGILYPDGQVIIPYDCAYEDEDGWLKDMIKRAAEKPKTQIQPEK